MSKLFVSLLVSGIITVPGGAKTTLVNTGTNNLFLTSDETEEALEALEYSQQTAVKNSLYSIAPGASKSLATGTYNLTLQPGCSAALLTEKSIPVPPVVVPPVVVPLVVTPPVVVPPVEPVLPPVVEQ